MNEELRVKCARVKNLTHPTRNKQDCRLFVAMMIILIIVKLIRSKTNLVWTVTKARIAVPGKSLLSSLILVYLIIWMDRTQMTFTAIQRRTVVSMMSSRSMKTNVALLSALSCVAFCDII